MIKINYIILRQTFFSYFHAIVDKHFLNCGKQTGSKREPHITCLSLHMHLSDYKKEMDRHVIFAEKDYKILFSIFP